MNDSQQPPGVALRHSPASTRIRLGSPSICVLPDGRYAASHDEFGAGSTGNRTYLYISDDRGATWRPLGGLHGQYWSTLFVHGGTLYIMGTIGAMQPAAIRRSDDGGRSWTEPESPRSGLLVDFDCHTAPTPVIDYAGRLWRTMEDRPSPDCRTDAHRAFMMSASNDADLLEARNWRCSTRLNYPACGRGWCWREGNPVVDPDGQIWIILRNDTQASRHIPGSRHGKGGLAIRVRVSSDGCHTELDPDTCYFDFPGGNKKFSIRHDPRSNCYWSLTNWIHPADAGHNPERTRNTLALIRSRDLFTWEVRAILLRHPDREHVGFQYADWQFDGDDIIALVRTAHPDGQGGARNCHDANFITFHRFKDFREPTLTRSDALSDVTTFS